jgi:hypothetical protein
MTIIIASSPQAVNWFTFVVLLSKTARRARGFGPAPDPWHSFPGAYGAVRYAVRGRVAKQFDAGKSVTSALMAFFSAWKARMSSTKRRATAGGSSMNFGMGLDIGAAADNCEFLE